MLPLFLLVFNILLRDTRSLETNVTYDLHYYTHSESCAGAAPSVELAARDKRSGSSGFGDWYLLRYHTGNCSSNKINSGRLLMEEGSALQLRLEFSPGAPCYYISLSDNFTFSTGLSVNATEFFCGVCLLCGMGDSSFHLSRVITVTDGELTLSTECTSSSETVSSTSNGVAVFVESFGGTCPESAEACFALQPLDDDSRVKINHQLAINFDGCRSLNVANEGVLLTAQIDNTKVFPICFYYSTSNSMIETNDPMPIYRYPQITFKENSMVNLTYSDGTTFEVNGTLQSQNPNSFVAHTFETDQLLYNGTKFNFSQMYISGNSNCDNWALDSVSVVVEHGNCSRLLLEHNFDKNPIGDAWEVYKANASQGAINCIYDNATCLYFTGWEGKRQLASRYASTPPLDLRVLSAIFPPKFSTTNNTCIAGEQLGKLSFLLRPIKFRQPSPCTDSTPNGIDLSIRTNEAASWKPLLYYAPVANAYWPGLNSSELTLMVDSTPIPIRAPSISETMDVYFCTPNDTSSLSVRWRQVNFGPEATDQWTLSNVAIKLEENVIFLDVVESELWNLTNGVVNASHACFTDLPPTTKLFAGSSTGSPRQAVLNVSLTTIQSSSTSLGSPTPTLSSSPSFVLSTSSSFPTAPPSPSPSVCPAENDTWPETPVGTSRNGSCGEGSMEVTRHCLSNGTWETLDCQPSSLFMFLLNQIMSSPETGLQLLQQELMSEDLGLSLYQSTVLFREVYLSLPPNAASPEFIQDFFTFASELISTGQDFTDISDEERRELGSLLLLTLDDFALNNVDLSKSISIITENIVLYLQEVLQPLYPVIGIQVEENNSIVLPIDIFTTNSSVKVASIFFRNLSLLLLPHEANVTVVSPVISSTTDCNECRTQELDTNVTITFTLPQENLPREHYNDSLFCAHWEFAEVREEDPPTGSWSTNGCYTSSEGPVIVCECNHLTHFAILLSPGVELPAEHAKILTALGYVLVPISLVCLLLTMLTYILFRSLWSMRSYIHVMLCGSMFAAQLVFVLGVERTANQVLCSVISVIILYLFLVMFMWMLMEGVILYVVLVKVFVEHKKRYLIAFTTFSFGIPALYLAILAPIGFTVNGGEHFVYFDKNGTLQACWLNYDTNFIWAFISPVVSIIIINVGFLIMSVVIMYRHQRKQTKKSNLAKARHWMKTIISLVLLMGIGWGFNLLFFMEELFVVAYLTAIFISGQGIGIFVLFVVFSKKVRQAVVKCWHARRDRANLLSKQSSSTKDTYKSSPSKTNEEKNGTCDIQLNGTDTFSAGSTVVKEYTGAINSNLLLQGGEDKTRQGNIYVVSEAHTVI